MNDSLAKPLSIALYALMGISVLLLLLFFVGVLGEGVLLSWTYLLIAIAAITTVVFPIIYLVQNPKDAQNTLIAVGALVVIFGLSYGLASGEVLDKYIKHGIDESSSRLVGMGIYATYILMAGAVGSIIFSAVSKAIK